MFRLFTFVWANEKPLDDCFSWMAKFCDDLDNDRIKYHVQIVLRHQETHLLFCTEALHYAVVVCHCIWQVGVTIIACKLKAENLEFQLFSVAQTVAMHFNSTSKQKTIKRATCTNTFNLPPKASIIWPHVIRLTIDYLQLRNLSGWAFICVKPCH